VKWALIAAIVLILAAAAGTTGYLLRQPSTTSPPVTASERATTPPVPPVAEAALEGLLLSPDQINTALGATAMTAGTKTAMYDASAYVEKACLPLHDPLEAAVYAGSGWRAFRAQSLFEVRSAIPSPHATTHEVDQDVVLFSSAHDAGAFFTASAERWPACSNRQYPIMLSDPNPPTMITVGPVSNTNGTLSATKTFGGEICQRALTVANNVAIDVMACSQPPSDKIPADFRLDSAVNIAHQIAAKVPA
jgi:serine/threonine-protein kinase